MSADSKSDSKSDDDDDYDRKPQFANSLSWLRYHALISLDKLLQLVKEEYLALPNRPNADDIQFFLLAKNRKRNRYMDIGCLDRTRVALNDGQGQDYIHANWVLCPYLPKRMVMTQAPTADTAVDFHRMLFQENVSHVVCLTQMRERNQEKAYPYWPTEVGRTVTCDQFTVHNSACRQAVDSVISTLDIVRCSDGSRKTVTHVFYQGWMDHKAPECTHRFLDFADMCQTLLAGGDQPQRHCAAAVIVHCSAGVGRSGTLLALMSLRKSIDRDQAPRIFSLVKDMRLQRALAVQSSEQYLFIYRTCMELIYRKHFGGNQLPKKDMLNSILVLRKMTTRSNCDLHPVATSAAPPPLENAVQPLPATNRKQNLKTAYINAAQPAAAAAGGGGGDNDPAQTKRGAADTLYDRLNAIRRRNFGQIELNLKTGLQDIRRRLQTTMRTGLRRSRPKSDRRSTDPRTPPLEEEKTKKDPGKGKE